MHNDDGMRPLQHAYLYNLTIESGNAKMEIHYVLYLFTSRLRVAEDGKIVPYETLPDNTVR